MKPRIKYLSLHLILCSMSFILLFPILSIAYSCDENAVKLIEKIDQQMSNGYSKKTFSDLNVIYSKLGNENKECLTKYFETNYNSTTQEKTYNCLDIIVFFNFFKDNKVFLVINKIYPKSQNNTILAACEVFYYCYGVKKDYYLKKYLDRLSKNTTDTENIMYASMPCGDKRVIKTMLNNEKTYSYDGSKAEYWFETMSWLEKDEKWISKERQTYLIKRLKEL